MSLLTLALGLSAIALSLYTFKRDTYPGLVEGHRWRQKFRVEYDGWTLPWWLCGLYWIGAERIAPKSLRHQSVTQPAERTN